MADAETLAFADLYSKKTRSNLNNVVCYLQIFLMKLLDPQYVVKIKIEEIFNLIFDE
jgi:hypothetical protein